MRDKTNTDWNNYNYTIKYSDGKVLSENHLNNKYSKAFISAKYFNKACYNCPAKAATGADLTIGDFWGVKEAIPDIDDRLGVSFITCNSARGQVVLDSLFDLQLQEVDINKVKKYNQGIQSQLKVKDAPYSADIFKKKVAIVTMNLHFNIGTALQAYAMQKVIQEAGYDCGVIT